VYFAFGFQIGVSLIEMVMCRSKIKAVKHVSL
jgi:hypothetical protein